MPNPNEAERHFLLRAALWAYPAHDRRGYGDELLEAAIELSHDGSTRWREAGGLLRGGVEARIARDRLGLSAINFAAALRQLTLPLAAFAIMVWGVAAAARILGSTNPWGYHGPTPGSVLLLTLLVLLVLGVARRQRGVATVAASGLWLQVFASALWHSARGGVVTASPALHLHLGSWWFGPNLIWSLVPLLVLLVPACWVMEPAAPRVEDLKRPLRERPLVRAACLLAPVAGFGALVKVAPQLIVDSVGETTEVPGIVFLMLIVVALWVATSARVPRDAVSTAAALAGLALVPSVAYGAARFAVSPFRSVIEDRDLLVGVAAGMAVVLVLLAASFFVVVISHVGLRTVDRRGGSPLTVGHALQVGADDPAHAG